MLFRRGSGGSGPTDVDKAAERRLGGAGTQLIRKNRALAIGLGAVIVSSLVSWGAASQIRSPAEVAARTAPPKPSVITVPVEKKVLSSDVVARGTVRYGAPQSVLLPASSIRRGSPILTTAPVNEEVAMVKTDIECEEEHVADVEEKVTAEYEETFRQENSGLLEKVPKQ